jgi:hypothetical protein
MADHFRHTFGAFQGDVSNETVSHHDIDTAVKDIVALDIAEIVQVTALQQFVRLLDLLVTLDLLFADIQKTDARTLDAAQRRNL